MCRAFQPFTMQGIYFSLCASTQIKNISLSSCLLQSLHILREQKPQFVPNLKNILFNDNLNANLNHFVQR